MRTLLLTLGVTCLLCGCGRKAAPVAENKAPAKPVEEWSRPQFPAAPKDDEAKPDQVANFGGPVKEFVPPVIEFPPPRREEPKQPKPPVEEEEEPVLPPRKPAVPKSARPKEPMPPQRIIEQEPQAPPKRVEPRPTQPQPVARKPVTEQDMKDIHLFIDTSSLASGQMPAAGLTFTALGASGSPAAKLVASGDIVLTNARQRESCWAYQKGAATDGGWIVTNSGAEQVDAATAKRWLGGR